MFSTRNELPTQFEWSKCPKYKYKCDHYGPACAWAAFFELLTMPEAGIGSVSIACPALFEREIHPKTSMWSEGRLNTDTDKK